MTTDFLTTTANDLADHRIVRTLGVVRGITVRSRGVFGTLGYFLITWAFRLLDISALQPLAFVGIVWASVFDLVIFGRTADAWTFLGAAIVVAASTAIAHREASRRIA